MEQLTLVPPSLELRDQLLAYREEFMQANEQANGSAGLDREGEFDFEAWLLEKQGNLKEETVKPGLVPETLLLGMAGGRLVGMVDVRHRLNDQLLHCGGHVGYSVRKNERRKGYATLMLKGALDVCRSLGLERVLLTCAKANVASAGTILRCGGVLENEEPDERCGIVQRYWISVQP